MKKFSKIISVAAAGVMGLSVFAFAACETDDELDSVTSETLYSGALATAEDIYSSATGYEINASIKGETNYFPVNDYNGIFESYRCNYFSIDAETMVKTKVTDGAFNADATAQGESVVKGTYYYYDPRYDEVTTTEEVSESEAMYGAAYLRGNELYAGGTTEETLSAIDKGSVTLYKNDVSEYTSVIDAYIMLFEDILSGENSEYAQIYAIVDEYSEVLGNILSDYQGSISTDSNGYSLVYDIDQSLLSTVSEFKTAYENVLNFITNTSSNVTIDNVLSNSYVKNYIESNLGGMTANQLYNVVYMVMNLVGVSAEIPEVTAGQTAYEYIISVVNALGYGDTVVNSESTIEVLQTIDEYLTVAQDAISSSQIGIELDFNSDCALTGISVVVDVAVTINDVEYSVDLSAAVSIENKDVTLEENINYVE